MKQLNRLLGILLSACLLFSCAACLCAPAEAASDGRVVVSLGDSYSSGEGLPPFYGQDKDAAQKVEDPDWLAHRSAKSWPGRLRLSGVSGTLADHRDTLWYFAAASGATTEHLTQEQAKAYNVSAADGSVLSGTAYLKPQLDVFDRIEGSADFVTVTIGGNDVGFESILANAALKSEREFALVLDETARNYYSTVRDKIKAAYYAIADRAGDQAAIIVAGYPTLLSDAGNGSGQSSAKKAAMLNERVIWFNAELEKLVEECRGEGLDIWFAPVESRFRSREAGSAEPHINGLILGAQEQDLNRASLISAYSMHPNEYGAADYAAAVQEVITSLDRDRERSARTDAFTPYSDLDRTQWYAEGVKYVLENGVMSGTGDGRFDPNGKTTRAQLATILWNMEGRPDADYAMRYADVSGGAWYADAVRWAAGEELMDGYGDGTFGPNDALSREQLVTILWRYAGGKGADVSAGGDTSLLRYDDVSAVSAWALPAMRWAVGSGVMGGKTATTLAPGDGATRAEIATIIMRYRTENKSG